MSTNDMPIRQCMEELKELEQKLEVQKIEFQNEMTRILETLVKNLERLAGA